MVQVQAPREPARGVFRIEADGLPQIDVRFVEGAEQEPAEAEVGAVAAVARRQGRRPDVVGERGLRRLGGAMELRALVEEVGPVALDGDGPVEIGEGRLRLAPSSADRGAPGEVLAGVRREEDERVGIVELRVDAAAALVRLLAPAHGVEERAVVVEEVAHLIVVPEGESRSPRRR